MDDVATLELAEAQLALAKAIKSVEKVQGEPGKTGKQGLVGPAGKSIRGPIGPAGKNGTNGTNGAKGDPGPVGPEGPAGKDGVGPDEQVRVSKKDPAAGFLADKLKAGLGVRLRQEKSPDGDQLVIDSVGQSGGMGGGGMAGVTVYDDGVAVGFGDKVSYDGGDPVTVSSGVIHVPVGSGGGAGTGTLAATLTAGNETDGTAIVANVSDDFDDVLLVETGDTGDLSGNAYVIRITDTVNNRHVFDLDAWGSMLIRGPSDPGAGSGGIEVPNVFAVSTNGSVFFDGTGNSAISIAGTFKAISNGVGLVGLGFFDKVAAPAFQQTSASLSDLWTALIAYGLLDSGSVAPAAGGGSGDFLSIAKWS